MKTNAERLAAYIAKNGADSILIHSVPRTPFWLVCQKVARNRWNISLANPTQTKSRLVSKNVTDEEHMVIYQQLTILEVSNRMQDALSAYRKRLGDIRYKRNKNKQ